MEDIRPDEDAVLKTAGDNHASGFESWSSALIETNSPVAQRRRHLVYTQSIDVRVRPGLLIEMALIRLVRGMPAKHAHLSSNLTSASIVNGPSVQPGVDAALSRQRSRFKSGMGRLNQMVWYANG